MQNDLAIIAAFGVVAIRCDVITTDSVVTDRLKPFEAELF